MATATASVPVVAALAVVAGMTIAHGQERVAGAGPGVPRSLADHRAAVISDLRYDLRLSIPAAPAAPVTGQVTATFDLTEPGPVIFDFAQPADRVRAVRVGGEPVAFEARNEHVIVPAAAVGAGHVVVDIDFTAGDGSLNRQPDFLYTLFVPDRARVAVPLFDQPNLKARFRLRLDVPAQWRAVANGSAASREVRGDRATFTFTETAPISSYLFAFAAGAFDVEEAERGGRRMTMYHRETDRERIERNAAAIFDLHASALAWLEEYTGIAFPFEKLDFVLVPAFQYGGMEHPGAIFYRADALLLDESATQQAHLGRAGVIAHETAHQWFGNLVTMEWFDDVWMKETFANFLAAKIVNPAFPELDHDLRFLLAHYPAAYGVDRTAGANPIRQPLDNLNEAGTLYGPIIYQKAPIVVAHLERLMGGPALRDGLRAYLAEHAYGNASWADLVAILDRRSEEDLAAWSRTWVDESGRPRIEATLETRGGAIARLALRQSDPGNRGRVWNQRLEVALGYGAERREAIEVHLREPLAEVPEAVGRPAPDYVLANGGALGYGLMALDPRTRDYLLASLPAIDDPAMRAVGWVSLWESLLEGEVDPEAFVALAAACAPGRAGRAERHPYSRLPHDRVLAASHPGAPRRPRPGDRDAALGPNGDGRPPEPGRGLLPGLPRHRAVRPCAGAAVAHLATGGIRPGRAALGARPRCPRPGPCRARGAGQRSDSRFAAHSHRQRRPPRRLCLRDARPGGGRRRPQCVLRLPAGPGEPRAGAVGTGRPRLPAPPATGARRGAAHPAEPRVAGGDPAHRRHLLPRAVAPRDPRRTPVGPRRSHRRAVPGRPPGPGAPASRQGAAGRRRAPARSAHRRRLPPSRSTRAVNPPPGHRRTHWTPAMRTAALTPRFSPAVPAFEMWWLRSSTIRPGPRGGTTRTPAP